uniref:uncharacterized protein PF3D7_1120600-like isoform X1 n=4 Tax=Vespula vulgaris TaxID=7454 RepID=UPI00223AA820|nr:uncharacterized protein PF3D7_1120600-like isoform X1 [Vespula vulgaris]
MSESYMTKKNIDDEEFLLLHSVENATTEKGNNAADSSMLTKLLKEDERHSDISLEESFKEVTHKKMKNVKPIETGNEFTVTSRTPSRLSHNFIQSWVNTGYLPYRTYNSDSEYSDTGSLNQKLSSYKTCDIPNTASIHRSNGKELCNSSSNCSSVDTAAYILSNTNVKKKIETMAIIVDSKCSSKISFQNTLHENTSCEKDETLIMHENLSNTGVDSNVSMSKSLLNIYNPSMKHMKNQRSEKNNVMKESKLPISHMTDTNEICENSKEGNDLNCHNTEELIQNLMEESIDAKKSLSFPCEGSFSHSKYFRQKKLYSGRDSPTDIIVARFKENDTKGTKKDLHPAFRNSPPIEETQKKILQKKRKTKFCLNNSMNKFFDISENDDKNEEVHIAKRQKTLTNIKNDVPVISQSLVNERLFISCNALKEQIKRFPTSDYIDVERRFTRLAAREMNGEKPESNVNAHPIVHDTLHENLNPYIILERLSEETLKYYTGKENTHIHIEELKEDDQINNREKDTQKSDFETFSNASRCTIFLPRLENNTDVVDSDVSTIIISNRRDVTSTDSIESDSSTIILNTSSILFNPDKMKKNQLDENSDNIKLKRLQPVVLLERLQVQYNVQTLNKIKQSKESVKHENMRREKHDRSKENSKDMSLSLGQGQLRKQVDPNSNSMILEKTLQSVIVLEKCINLQKNGQNQNQMDNTLNNDSIHVTPSKEKQLTKLKNSDDKLLKKPIVKLNRLSHLTITTHINHPSEMYNSFDERMNNSNSKSVESNELNKNHVEINNISSNNSSIDSTEKETKIKRTHLRKSNRKKSLLSFRTRENYSNSSDSDSDSSVPFIQCIFNVYAEQNQKQFSKKQITKSKLNPRTLIYDSDESILTRSRSNSLKNLSIMKNINNILNHSKTKNIKVNMTCSSNKQYGASTSGISSKNNSEWNNSIKENNKKTAINRDNIQRFTFHTKAYDSDSD